MTYREAANIIEDVTWQDNGRHYGKIATAREIAISALEKQIPKKPIEDSANLTDFKTFHCPICNKKIVSRVDGEWIAGSPQKYCDDCGQALDFNSNGSDTE